MPLVGSYSTCKESGSNSRISCCSLHCIVLFVKHFGSTWLVDLTYLDKYHQNAEGCIEITTTLDSQDCFKTSNHQHLCPPFHCEGGGGQGGQFIHGHGGRCQSFDWQMRMQAVFPNLLIPRFQDQFQSMHQGTSGFDMV